METMSHELKTPVTPAIRTLREAGVSFTEHQYEYVEKGGTAATSAELGVAEHEVVKTLVFEDDAGRPFIVLMHGDRNVSTKELARQIGVKRTAPCTPEKAQKHSGYVVGGTSPFGTRTALPVYVERSILALPRIFINGGHRGFILEMSVQDLCRVVETTPVDVAIVPQHAG
jgi:Cys-tRNA(Pro) deacylase